MNFKHVGLTVLLILATMWAANRIPLIGRVVK